MGVEYRGQLVVGYDIDELETIAFQRLHIEDYEDMNSREKSEVLGMEKFAPYYDADPDDCIYGRSIAQSDDYSATQVSLKEIESVAGVVVGMFEEFGIRPDVYIMAEGT